MGTAHPHTGPETLGPGTTVQGAVAAAVRQAIEDAGETQLGVAEKTGIPRTTLMRRLGGHSPFTVAELAAIADALGRRIPDFIPEGSVA